MKNQTKAVWVGSFLLVIMTGLLIITNQDNSVRMEISKDNTSIYINESGNFILGGVETTSILNNIPYDIQTKNTNKVNFTTLERISKYNISNKIVTLDSKYSFNASLKTLESFPIYEEHKITNGIGLKFCYDVKIYSTRVKVTFENSKTVSESYFECFNITKSPQTFNIRIFDPEIIINYVNITAQYSDGTNTTNYAYYNANNLTCNVEIVNNATNPYFQWTKNSNVLSLNTGLVAWYRLNNETGENQTKVLDWSGNRNNGTVVNATYTPNGKINGAYNFSKLGYVTTNLETFNASKEYTISVWAKWDNNSKTDTNQRDVIMMTSSSGSYPYVSISYRNSTGTPRIYFRSQYNSSGCDYAAQYSNNSIQDGNNWYHIVGTFNSTTYKLYLNGNDITTTNPTQACLNILKTLPLINKTQLSNTAQTSYFNGTIDEVRIYNRSLSASEILDLYNLDKNTYNNTLSIGDNLSCYATVYNSTYSATSSRNITIENPNTNYTIIQNYNLVYLVNSSLITYSNPIWFNIGNYTTYLTQYNLTLYNYTGLSLYNITNNGNVSLQFNLSNTNYKSYSSWFCNNINITGTSKYIITIGSKQTSMFNCTYNLLNATSTYVRFNRTIYNMNITIIPQISGIVW